MFSIFFFPLNFLLAQVETFFSQKNKQVYQVPVTRREVVRTNQTSGSRSPEK